MVFWRCLKTINGGIMDKKYLFGIFIALIVFASGCVTLQNQGGSSDSGDSQKVNTSAPKEQSVNNSASELKTIRHGYLPSNGGALIFIAKEEGFWTKEGLNVELYQFAKGPDAYNALFGNKIDTVGAGTGAPATFIAKEGRILPLLILENT